MPYDDREAPSDLTATRVAAIGTRVAATGTRVAAIGTRIAAIGTRVEAKPTCFLAYVLATPFPPLSGDAYSSGPDSSTWTAKR